MFSSKHAIATACLATDFVLLGAGHGLQAEPVSEDLPATLVEGTGEYSHPIDTSSPRAQAFFDQGLRLTWGCYLPEAPASFREALRLDPDNPMIHWGLALAVSPNPNSRYDVFPDHPEGVGGEAIAAAKSISGLSERHSNGTRKTAGRCTACMPHSRFRAGAPKPPKPCAASNEAGAKQTSS